MQVRCKVKKTYLSLAGVLLVVLTALSGVSFSQIGVAAAQSATPIPTVVAAPVIVPPAADASAIDAFQGIQRFVIIGVQLQNIFVFRLSFFRIP